MKRVFISGISGFLGQALEKRLVSEGNYEIYGVYENHHNFEKNLPSTHKHVCNLLDFQKMEKLISKIQPHIVIHLAAKTEVEYSFYQYIKVSEVNYVGTVNLAEANRKFNPSLELFIHASTMETYGHHDKSEGAFTEETPQNPMAPYAVAKLAVEHYLKYMAHAYKFPFAALRQTNTYGRHDNDFFVVEQMITQMLANKDEVNFGYAEPYRNFLYVDDLIDLYMALLKHPKKATGHFFVTGPDNAIQIKELAQIIAKKLGWKGKINWDTKPNRPGEIFYLNSNPAKAKAVLNWEPKVSLSEGLDKTISIWQKKYASEKEQVHKE